MKNNFGRALKLRKELYQMSLNVLDSGAPNENIVQNHLNMTLLNVF